MVTELEGSWGGGIWYQLRVRNLFFSITTHPEHTCQDSGMQLRLQRPVTSLRLGLGTAGQVWVSSATVCRAVFQGMHSEKPLVEDSN